jgi:CheY-like chemotaxis protein
MILLADDEPAFQRLTAGWLRAQGHEVVAVGDGDAARAAFVQHRPDVVLLDLAMPPHHDPQGGIALISTFAPAPVVVMTGHADQALAMRAIEAGAWDFLAKPVDPDMLKVVVARAVERARLAQELAALRARDEASEDMGLIGHSPPMVALRALIRRVAPTRLPVMALGPSGTGKELVARAIHAGSPRAKAPWCRCIAVRFRRICWKASCSGTSRAASRAHMQTGRGWSRRRMAARCSSTRLARCRPQCRSSCCASSPMAPISQWGARDAPCRCAHRGRDPPRFGRRRGRWLVP